ncbi:hypothetical protein POPTR_013G157100v4 [Populus trichocarpa]|uniref:NADH:ubiquinone reductase (non-electrogenic) n=1 Tax=Populus trichocarpa TaxID=3694 RepID=A0A2K1Y5R9_POPTR|nr:uncharacterized protein LOC7465178 [Populus trichocarpa]PNT08386.3 hypothetical protein POPTR_013G157100v4 [Populus trichocarpa]
MGDLRTLAMARMELEELYLGIPDDSVNLTFEDLAIHVKQHISSTTSEKINTTTTSLESIQEVVQTPKQAAPLTKLPSLDFNKGLQASKNHHQSHHLDHVSEGHPFDKSHKHYLHDGTHRPYGSGGQYHDQSHHVHANIGPKSPSKSRFAMERSREYDDDDVSVMNMNSMYQERSGRPRRPGIPHSNICTVCSTYIYIFRHRCLVCGRVFCRNCVSAGMGEMTEGRKCIECLGRKFSQRYINRAGIVGCCSGYPSAVKQAELKWAEKGPRKAGERAFGHSTMTSRSRSPLTPRTPRTPNKAAGVSMSQDLPSFVTSAPYSPYSTPKHHHLPL